MRYRANMGCHVQIKGQQVFSAGTSTVTSRCDLTFLGPSQSVPLRSGGISHPLTLVLSWAKNKGGKPGARQHFCGGLEPSRCDPHLDSQEINRDYRLVLSPAVSVFNNGALLTKEETFACFPPLCSLLHTLPCASCWPGK